MGSSPATLHSASRVRPEGDHPAGPPAPLGSIRADVLRAVLLTAAVATGILVLLPAAMGAAAVRTLGAS